MPSISSVTINTGLTNFALGYAPQAGRFIANDVAPVIPVGKQAGSFFVHGREHLDDHSAILKRNADGTYARVDHAYSSDTYACEDYGLEEIIMDPVQTNADSGIDPLQDAVAIIREQMLLAQEKRVSAVVTAASLSSTVDTALSGTAQWTHENSDPMTNVKTLIDAVHDQTGAPATALLMNRAVFRALTVHPDILERIKYGGTNATPAIVTANMLAQLFGVDKILVGSAVYNSAKQGQNRSLASIWPNSVVAFHSSPGAAMGVPMFCSQFSWRADTGGQDMVVENYRSDSRRGEVVRVRQYRDEKAVGVLFAALYSTVVA